MRALYSENLVAIGGVPPYSWSLISGGLPPDLTLSAQGPLSGIPTEEGTFNFTARVTDEEGKFAEKEFALTINPEKAAEVVSFHDPNLEVCVKSALGIGPTDPITTTLAQTLTSLDCNTRGIQSLNGLESLSNLTTLSLFDNTISDITPLSGLIQLTFLNLPGNSISDISPLVANPGLGVGDQIDLFSNLLDTGDCADLQILIDREADVFHDVICP